MLQERVPVLIVGGGIVGLSASLFLSHQGIRSLLVERHFGTSIHPRARGVNVRTMELYREIGLEDEIRAAGAALQAAIGLLQGETLIGALKDHGPEQRKQILASFQKMATGDEISPTSGSRGTQDLVEPLLRTAASQRGGDLRFSTELLSFEQSEEGVRALIRNRVSGVESSVHADYMLAADGANSPVLHALGIPSSGSGPLGYLLNVLFQADLSEVVRGREFSICKIERPEVTGLFISINNSDRWCFHILYDPQKGEKPEDYPAERCQELVRLALGLPSIEIEIKNVLPWVSTVRVAETFQQGRIFLAGDAAHQMPPWGGQGANTGIPDVHNLAWKLAAVLKGEAEPALLDTYNVERQPVGRLAAETSGQRSDERGLLSFNTMAVQIAGKAFQEGGYFQMLGGYGYKYRSQAIMAEGDDESVSLNGQPGTRTPHAWVEYEGKRLSTLDLFGLGFVLLTGQAGSPWCVAARKVADRLGVDIKAYRVGPDADLHDPENHWVARAGLNEDGALLVRPDGFVAWRSSKLVAEPGQMLEQVLSHLLCRVTLSA